MTTAEIIFAAFDLLSPVWVWLAYRAGQKPPAPSAPPPSGDGVRAAIAQATATEPAEKPAPKRRGRPPKKPPPEPAPSSNTPLLPM